MKFPSKITLAVLAVLLGSTVGAYAFVAPVLMPKVLFTQQETQIMPGAQIQRRAQSSEVFLVPAARPFHQDLVNRAEKLFARSA